MSDKASEKRAKKKPKKITDRYLHNVALYYLERFAASADSLRQVLRRRVYKSAAFHKVGAATREEWFEMVEALITRFEEVSLLDDGIYALHRAKSLFARGAPTRAIRMKLRQKGVAEDHIERALSHLGEDVDLNAAATYIKRRKLGPYRLREQDNAFKKDLQKLARAGFSYDIAKKVLES